MVEIQTPDHGKFEAASTWRDITLKQFEELAKLEIPETLRDLWLSRAKGDEKRYNAAQESMDSARHMGENADYFREVMSVLTTVPKNILRITEWSLVTEFYYEYLHQFVISTFYQVPVIREDDQIKAYKPPTINSFEYRDKTYYLPKRLKVFAEDIPMADESIGAFAEAADIEIAFKDLEEKGAEKFAVIIGIYCREKDQHYKQSEALQRAEAFRNLNMETVWAVFFCILELYKRYTNDIRRYLKNPQELLKKRRSAVVSWTTSIIEV